MFALFDIFRKKPEPVIPVRVAPVLPAPVVEAPKKVEPYFVVKTARYDPNRGIQMEFDWNDEFIDELALKGIKAASPEDAIQKWISILSQQIQKQLQEGEFVANDSDGRSTYE